MDIIQTKLLVIEYDAIKNKEANKEKLKAIKNVRDALLQIDFLAEYVPLESEAKLSQLLISLKGRELTEIEVELVKELIKK